MVAISTMVFASMQGSAEEYQISDLAFPISVAPGQEVSFVINESEFPWYLYAAGGDPNNPNYGLELFAYQNGSMVWEAREDMSWKAGGSMMDPGRWNLSFETNGRIAVAHELSGICIQTTISPEGLVDDSCPVFITETTAFAVNSWISESALPPPYTLSVQGDVDAYFYDEYLQPLGQADERLYETTMMGIVVIVPHGNNATVTFSIEPASSYSSLAWIGIFLMIPVIAAVAVILILAKRRNEKMRTEKASLGLKSKRN